MTTYKITGDPMPRLNTTPKPGWYWTMPDRMDVGNLIGWEPAGHGYKRSYKILTKHTDTRMLVQCVNGEEPITVQLDGNAWYVYMNINL